MQSLSYRENSKGSRRPGIASIEFIGKMNIIRKTKIPRYVQKISKKTRQNKKTWRVWIQNPAIYPLHTRHISRILRFYIRKFTRTHNNRKIRYCFGCSHWTYCVGISYCFHTKPHQVDTQMVFYILWFLHTPVP